MEGFEGLSLFVEIVRAHWRYLRWIVALWIYFGVSVATFGLGFVGILGVFGLALGALMADRRREAADSDDFRKTALFHRYGRQLRYSTFSIPVQQGWESGEAVRLAGELRDGIAASIAQRLPGAVDVLSPREIKDLDARGESGKILVRIRSLSHRRSLLVHFLHFAPVGQSVTAHHFTFLRCAYSTLDEIAFIYFSPFTIWIWGLAWLQKRHSVLSHLNMSVSNSFDEIDLKTLLEATNYVISDVTEAVLKDNGLLTEELHQLIVNNTNYNHQRLDLRHANNVRLGAVTNLTSPAAVN